MHNDDGVAANGGDKIMIAHASTDMHDTDQTSTRWIVVQNDSRGPSRSKSSFFHQQARVAMMAAGIESRSSSKSTDEYGSMFTKFHHVNRIRVTIRMTLAY